MIIDWLGYERNRQESLVAWFLLETMSKAGIEKFGDFDSSELDVVLTVNGVEVPVVPVLEFLQSQITRIEDEARKRGRDELAEELIDRGTEFLRGLTAED